jgi:predicted Zn-dependent protease
MPGTNQLQAEDILEKHQKIIHNFPETNGKTYFLLLTTSDINSKTGGFRFQFSFHNKDLMTSVVSMARLFNYIDGKPVADNIAMSRLYKMTKRAIGEMYFGWQRSTNIEDVMYSPLMGVPDLDRIGVNHIKKEDKKEKDDQNGTKDNKKGVRI